MIHSRGSGVFRLLSAAVLTIQVLIGGLAAVPHDAERQGGARAAVTADHAASPDIQCPLCRFASQPARELPTYEISIAAATITDSPVPARSLVDSAPEAVLPPSRAPPAI